MGRIRDAILGVDADKGRQFVEVEERIKNSGGRPTGRDGADYQRLQREIPRNQQNEARRRFGS